jgi:2-oxoisovalerate ferredoxin oxidoreductase beta subunit
MHVTTAGRPQSLFGQFERKPGDHLTTHYCPGCGHGNLHKYIAEAIDELGIQDRTIIVNPVGCSVFAHYYFDVGHVQVAHGRAPAAATAIKRALPDSVVVSYQGDGDLAAIGGNEILHAANRGENITVFFVNNAIYGMTGGQMAPTTLLGQKTITTPLGRTVAEEGYPLRAAELLATLEGSTYVERVAMFDNKSRMRTRKVVKKALQNQVEGRGFSLVEVLSPCPTGWGLAPTESCEWLRDHLVPRFPLGVIKDESASREGWTRRRHEVDAAEIPAILGLVRHTAGAPAARGDMDAVPPQYRNPRIRIAGFGGQGVLFLGKLLAEVGMAQGFHVSWLPSYGPEMRGGTANCHVNISTEPVGSPLVSSPSLLVAFNGPSLARFAGEVQAGGTIIYDSSIVDQPPQRHDVDIVPVPIAEIAASIGSSRVANMVALGAFAGLTGLVDRAGVTAALEAVPKYKPLMSANLQAFDMGAALVATQRSEATPWGV